MYVYVCTASILPYQFFDGLLLLRGLLKPHSQYVCMYVCMYVYNYAFMYEHMYVCILKWVRIH